MKSSLNPLNGKFAATVIPFATSLAFVCAALAASAQNYDATILSNQPAVYYELQESSGASTALDSSGHGNNATIDYDLGYSGTNDYPALGLPGVDTNAYLFHTYTDTSFQSHVSDVDGYNPNPQGPFSIEFWARATSDANNYLVPVGAVSGSYPQPGWDFYQTPGAPGSWVFNVPSAGAFIQTSQVVKNQWTHLVGVYDGTHLIFYVNGVATATASGTGFTAGTSPLYIGHSLPSGWGGFDGYLTQVAFYTNALTAAQILNDYKVGTNSFATNGEPPQVLVDAGATNSNPQSLTVTAGSTATFDPIVIGSTPLSYQWYSNGVAVAGATSSLLTFTTTAAANNSTYYVIVTNNFGSATSQVATLTVNNVLVINSGPMSISRYVGSYAAFHVTASGASPLAYQWSASTDGGSTFHAIAGATNESYWLSNVQLSENGYEYSVFVSGPGVSSTPAAATLSVSARPVNVPLTGYGALVAADHPVAFWELNEPSGSTAIDAVGSFNGAYTLAVTNGVTDTSSILFGETGGVPDDTNTAVGLVSPVAGLGGTIQVPWAPELNPDTPWSVETWVQPTSLGANGGDYRIVLSSEYNLGYPNPIFGWYIYQQPSDTFAFVPQPANAFVVAGSITAGSWYHLVVTDDGTNFRFYINGILATAPYTASGFTPNGDGINPDGTAAIDSGLGNAQFVIGQRTDQAFNLFQGNVEDTAVYNYALTPQQIQAHFLNEVSLSIVKSGGNAIVNWPAGTGTLEESTHVNGPYTLMTGVVPPYTNSLSGTMFYRLLRQ